MLVTTLKRCAGKLNFPPDVEVDLPESAVTQLLADGAVKVIKAEQAPEKQETEKPTKGK